MTVMYAECHGVMDTFTDLYSFKKLFFRLYCSKFTGQIFHKWNFIVCPAYMHFGMNFLGSFFCFFVGLYGFFKITYKKIILRKSTDCCHEFPLFSGLSEIIGSVFQKLN